MSHDRDVKEMEVQLHSFLKSALDGVVSFTPLFALICGRNVFTQSRTGRSGIESRAVQCLASYLYRFCVLYFLVLCTSSVLVCLS
jgi:hypothetical protein